MLLLALLLLLGTRACVAPPKSVGCALIFGNKPLAQPPAARCGCVRLRAHRQPHARARAASHKRASAPPAPPAVAADAAAALRLRAPPVGVAAAHGCPPKSRKKIVDDLIDDLEDTVNCDNLTSQESQQSVSINHFTLSYSRRKFREISCGCLHNRKCVTRLSTACLGCSVPSLPRRRG